MKKKKGLRSQLWKKLRQCSPWLLLRIAGVMLLLFPFLLYSLIRTWSKMRRWRKVRWCRRWMEANAGAFPGVDFGTLQIESASGGVSNSNEIWHCQTRGGEPRRYFVKIFVDLGSFWARHLSWVSPFPHVNATEKSDRFLADMTGRVEARGCGVMAPQVLAFDPVEKVIVTDFIEGPTVDARLEEMAERGSLNEEDRAVIAQCGESLGRLHHAGFSLVDTQPVNCLWHDGEIYFTDFEYFTREDLRTWDVGYFFCFLTVRLPPRLKHEACDIFFGHYRRVEPVAMREVARTTTALKEYRPLFESLLDIRRFTPEEIFSEMLAEK